MISFWKKNIKVISFTLSLAATCGAVITIFFCQDNFIPIIIGYLLFQFLLFISYIFTVFYAYWVENSLSKQDAKLNELMDKTSRVELSFHEKIDNLHFELGNRLDQTRNKLESIHSDQSEINNAMTLSNEVTREKILNTLQESVSRINSLISESRNLGAKEQKEVLQFLDKSIESLIENSSTANGQLLKNLDLGQKYTALHITESKERILEEVINTFEQIQSNISTTSTSLNTNIQTTGETILSETRNSSIKISEENKESSKNIGKTLEQSHDKLNSINQNVQQGISAIQDQIEKSSESTQGTNDKIVKNTEALTVLNSKLLDSLNSFSSLNIESNKRHGERINHIIDKVSETRKSLVDLNKEYHDLLKEVINQEKETLTNYVQFGFDELNSKVDIQQTLAIESRDQIIKNQNSKTKEQTLSTEYLYDKIDALFSIHSLLKIEHPLPIMHNWRIGADYALILIDKFLSKDGIALDIGCGVSTILLGYAAKLKGAKGSVFAFEHSATYAEQTREMIRQHNLQEYAMVLSAPLVPYELDGITYNWYSIEELKIEESLALISVDGPPGAVNPMSRYPVIPVLEKYINSETLILLDDASRDDELKCVKYWTTKHNMNATELKTERGCFELTQE